MSIRTRSPEHHRFHTSQSREKMDLCDGSIRIAHCCRIADRSSNGLNCDDNVSIRIDHECAMER